MGAQVKATAVLLFANSVSRSTVAIKHTRSSALAADALLSSCRLR
jgi:hypothetical protein